MKTRFPLRRTAAALFFGLVGFIPVWIFLLKDDLSANESSQPAPYLTKSNETLEQIQKIFSSFPDFRNLRSPKSLADLCNKSQNLEAFQMQLQSSWNTLTFANSGGISVGTPGKKENGVCWWHSRFTRNATYLTHYDKQAKKPSEEEIRSIIDRIRTGREIVRIPGYSNLEKFSSAARDLIQKELEQWQRRDVVRNAINLPFWEGSTESDPIDLEQRMNDLFKQVVHEKKIVYQMLNTEGWLGAHAWLVLGMKESENGYTLTILESRTEYDEEIEYTKGDRSLTLNSESVGPYTQEEGELEQILSVLRNGCREYQDRVNETFNDVVEKYLTNSDSEQSQDILVQLELMAPFVFFPMLSNLSSTDENRRELSFHLLSQSAARSTKTRKLLIGMASSSRTRPEVRKTILEILTFSAILYLFPASERGIETDERDHRSSLITTLFEKQDPHMLRKLIQLSKKITHTSEYDNELGKHLASQDAESNSLEYWNILLEEERSRDSDAKRRGLISWLLEAGKRAPHLAADAYDELSMNNPNLASKLYEGLSTFPSTLRDRTAAHLIKGLSGNEETKIYASRGVSSSNFTPELFRALSQNLQTDDASVQLSHLYAVFRILDFVDPNDPEIIPILKAAIDFKYVSFSLHVTNWLLNTNSGFAPEIAEHLAQSEERLSGQKLLAAIKYGVIEPDAFFEALFDKRLLYTDGTIDQIHPKYAITMSPKQLLDGLASDSKTIGLVSLWVLETKIQMQIQEQGYADPLSPDLIHSLRFQARQSQEQVNRVARIGKLIREHPPNQRQ